MKIKDIIQDIHIQSCKLEHATLPDLKKLIEKATALRMIVAFWTIKSEIVSQSLADLLAEDDSFACVDMHLPTNVDYICDIAEKGANMFFHGDRLNDRKRPDKGSKIPRNLLHSKVLLFDFYDNELSELWVGSHNWTEYSLGGFNIETSLRLRLKKNRCYIKMLKNYYRVFENGVLLFNQNCVKFTKGYNNPNQQYLF